MRKPNRVTKAFNIKIYLKIFRFVICVLLRANKKTVKPRTYKCKKLVQHFFFPFYFLAQYQLSNTILCITYQDSLCVMCIYKYWIKNGEFTKMYSDWLLSKLSDSISFIFLFYPLKCRPSDNEKMIVSIK